MTKKISKRESISGFSYSRLDTVRQKINKLIAEYGADARLIIESHDEYGYEGATTYVEFERPETSKESKERKRTEADARKWRQKQYKKLKEEFEDDS